MSPSFAVFLQLIANIILLSEKKGYDNDQAIKISHFVHIRLLNLGLTSGQVQIIKAYLDHNHKPDSTLLMGININTEKLRDITQSLYELFCNSFGPVKTDELFAQAIVNVEKSKLAAIFHPKELF
jgi:hypothetical protein